VPGGRRPACRGLLVLDHDRLDAAVAVAGDARHESWLEQVLVDVAAEHLHAATVTAWQPRSYRLRQPFSEIPRPRSPT
jgi:hypothetical protein